MQTFGIENECTMGKNRTAKIQNTLTNLQLIKINNYIPTLPMIFNSPLIENHVGKSDGVAMDSPLGPLLVDVFVASIEEQSTLGGLIVHLEPELLNIFKSG